MDVFGIGPLELLVILAVILIVVGPNRLPEMAAQLAHIIRDARRYAASISKDFNETVKELEHEYDDMKGEWKEVEQGLNETARDVNDELKAVDTDTREVLNEAQAAADETSKPVSPSQ